MIESSAVRVVPDRHVRIDLQDGWVEMRPMSANDLIAISRVEGVKDLHTIYERIGKAVVSHSYGGDFLDQPLETVEQALGKWRGASEDDALPPDQGEPA